MALPCLCSGLNIPSITVDSFLLFLHSILQLVFQYVPVGFLYCILILNNLRLLGSCSLDILLVRKTRLICIRTGKTMLVAPCHLSATDAWWPSKSQLSLLWFLLSHKYSRIFFFSIIKHDFLNNKYKLRTNVTKPVATMYATVAPRFTSKIRVQAFDSAHGFKL